MLPRDQANQLAAAVATEQEGRDVISVSVSIRANCNDVLGNVRLGHAVGNPTDLFPYACFYERRSPGRTSEVTSSSWTAGSRCAMPS